MRLAFDSAEHFGISTRRLLALALGAALLAALIVRIVTIDVLGGAVVEGQAILALVVFYGVLSAPKRMLKSLALEQSREAVLLSVVAKACLGVSGSRSRTILLLDSNESGISDALYMAKKRILLGWRPKEVVEAIAPRLSSYSAANALKGLTELPPSAMNERGDEAEGLSASSGLADETYLPIFLTTCFFAPILLLLYSVFSHLNSTVQLVELVSLEFVILDAAFYLCSSERRGESRTLT